MKEKRNRVREQGKQEKKQNTEAWRPHLQHQKGNSLALWSKLREADSRLHSAWGSTQELLKRKEQGGHVS